MTKPELEAKVKELEAQIKNAPISILESLSESVQSDLTKAIKSGSLPFLLEFGNAAERLLSDVKTKDHCELFLDSTAKAIGSGFVSKVTGNRKEWTKEQKAIQDRFTGLQKFVSGSSLELRVSKAAQKAAQKAQELQIAKRIGEQAANAMQAANA
jgi:hypothetical protein